MSSFFILGTSSLEPKSLFAGLEVTGEPKEASPPQDPEQGLNFLDELKGEHFDLEKAIVQMQEIKARAATLPDHERRQLAASVALKFAMLLGGDSDEELDFQ